MTYKRKKNKRKRNERYVSGHTRNGVKVSGYYRKKQGRNKYRKVKK